LIRLSLLFTVYCILFTGPIYGTTTPDTYAREVQAHLLIHDPLSACDKAREGLKLYQDNTVLWEAYISALSEAGFEKEMTLAWQHYSEQFPNPHENRKLIENMAWGVIQKASYSHAPMIRIYALLGAFYGKDARGVHILNRLLKDSNTLIRLAAIQLSSRLNDASLCDTIAASYYSEKCAENRIELIKAIGAMKIKSLKPQLVALLSNQKSSAEEKAAAIQSIINLMDTVERQELINLTSSPRAGLRLLACQAVAHFDLQKDLDLILPLLNDNSSEVRAAVLQLLGILRVDQVQGEKIAAIASSRLKDGNPLVALSAAWLLTIHDPENGQKAFLPWFSNGKQELRVLAAAVLGSCGKYAFPLIQNVFTVSTDKFVKLNLAHALLVNRVDSTDASTVLFEAINDQNEKLDWEENGIFRSIIKSENRYTDNPEENPVALSQLVKLELLNMLALIKFPKTQEAVISFLKQKEWGISGMAAALLLTEGDESAVDIVRGLLNYPVFKVRIQAAIILALWGQGEDAVQTLQEAYAGADRDIKERILEAIGRVHSPASIPFLLKQLQEPSQKLRIIAACALLECLYN